MRQTRIAIGRNRIFAKSKWQTREITGVCKGDAPVDCDFIQIWNGEGDFNAYYCWADDGLWYNVDGDAPLTEDYPDGIPAGTPFWFVAEKDGAREGDAKITFNNPLAK